MEENIILEVAISELKKLQDNEKLELAISALEKIAFPLDYLKNEADKDGTKLDGISAIYLCNDANWLRDLAKKALTEIANHE